MTRKNVAATLVFALVGALLLGGWAWLPDPRDFTADDARLIREAYRVGQQTDCFPGWDPSDTPILLTKGSVNYLINYPGGGPAGRTVAAAAGLNVTRLNRPEIPVLANGVIPIQGRPVAVVAGKIALEGLLGGMAGEMDLASGGGEGALIKAFMRTDPGRRLTDEEYVGVILHEAFHAHQFPVLERWLSHLPADEEQSALWSTLYTDPENSRLQIREGQALLAAVQAGTDAEARTHALEFLRIRKQREVYWKERLGPERAGALLAWEAFYEWLEGLARYIQVCSASAETRDAWLEQIGQPVEGLPLRERVYRLGAGQALVLDRLSPGWQEEVACPTLWQQQQAPVTERPAPVAPHLHSKSALYGSVRNWHNPIYCTGRYFINAQ